MVKRNLKEFRERILGLDGRRCQNPDCPEINQYRFTFFSAHHIKYRSQGGDESDGNGITFCNFCDQRAHHGYKDKDGNRIIPHRFVLDVLEKLEGKPHDRWRVAREELKLTVERLEFKK